MLLVTQDAQLIIGIQTKLRYFKRMLTINTTLVIAPNSSENSLRANTACSTISAVDRCFLRPILHKSKKESKHKISTDKEGEKTNGLQVYKPSSEAKLTVHGTTNLTRNTDSCPAPSARNDNCFNHWTIFKREQYL